MAEYASPLSAWLGQRDANQRAGLVDTQNAVGIMGVLAQIQRQQQAAREQAVFSPENIARNTIPGRASVSDVSQTNQSLDTFEPQSAIAPKIDVNALRLQGALTGPKGMETYSAHIEQQQNRQIQLATLRQNAEQNFKLRMQQATNQADRDAANAEFRQDMLEFKKIAAGNLPVQTFTDAQGNLLERARGATRWTSAVGPDGQPITGKMPSNPDVEKLYRDYANHPQVKAANDIEAKMQPLVDYMIAFKKTGKSVNANDEALAKAYLSITTPVGSRAYSMDKKALAGLPNLGDRLGNMASSFFSGHDLTDQTRTDMFNYIVQHYKALDAARMEQKSLTIRRGAARRIAPEQIFGVTE